MRQYTVPPMTPNGKSSSALILALVVGGILLLALALWSFRATEPSPDAKSGETAELSGGADSALSHATNAGSEKNHASPDRQAAATPPASPDPAPAIMSGSVPSPVPEGAPSPRFQASSHASDSFSTASPESEYQRQNRIWREGVASGRAHRESRIIQNTEALEKTAANFFPDDQTGQILFLLGYEWGSRVSTPPL